MITPDLELVAQELINKIIDNLETLDECGSASVVIDTYENQWPNSVLIKDLRERLCDKTFDVYFDETIND